MAAPTGDGTDATADEVARCLNSLTLLNMRNIASEDVLNELMNDYFVTRPIGDDSDSSGSDVESEPGSEPEVSRTVNVYTVTVTLTADSYCHFWYCTLLIIQVTTLTHTYAHMHTITN